MGKQATCMERVGDHLNGRMEDLRLLYSDPEEWDEAQREDAASLGVESQEHFDGDELIDEGGLREKLLTVRCEYGLSFDYVAPGTFTDQEQGYFRYQLSWGGPADEFRFFVNPDLTCYRIEYWFLDWGDGAKKHLSGEDNTLLMEIWREFEETGTAKAEYDRATE